MPSAHRAAFIVFAALGLTGCATLVEGTGQNIAISTPPTQGAYCVLTRPGGRFIVTTPGVLHLDKTADDLAIRCTHPGFADASGTIPAQFEGWTLGDAALGVVPVVVDVATGAMHAYPTEFALPMTPLGANRATYAPVTPQAGSPVTAPSAAALPGTLPSNF